MKTMDWNRIRYRSLTFVMTAVVSVLLAPGCLKDSVDDVLKSDTRRIGVELSIETKTTLNSDRTALVWSEGDRIALKNNATEDVLELTYKAGGSLEADVPSEATKVTAVYPFSMASGINVPKSQTQSAAGTLDSRRLPMTSEGTIAGNCVRLSFAPAAGALALNLYKSTGLAAADSVKALRVVSYTLTLDGHYALASLKPADRKTFPGQLYVVLPRAQYEAPTFEIETTLGLYTISMKTGTGIALDTNDFYALNIDLAKAQFELGAVLSSSESYTKDSDYEFLKEWPEPRNCNIIPDFSTVGYHYGEKEIPTVPVGITLTPPSDGSDATALIQEAIDNCPSGAAVCLKAGTYNIDSTIFIDRSDIVLRGEGAAKTTIHATGSKIRDILSIGKTGRVYKEKWDTSATRSGSDRVSYTYPKRYTSGNWTITDSIAPCGRWFVTLPDADGLSEGDDILVVRTTTQAWLDSIGPGSAGGWYAKSYTMNIPRVVTEISGNRIYLDAPLPFQIENGFGSVCKYTQDLLEEVGIEYLAIDSEFDSTRTSVSNKQLIYSDEAKMFNCITMGACVNCWVRGVEGRNFTQSIVRLDSYSKNVSVLDCIAKDPVSLITGMRRYAYHICGTMNLVKDCTCEYDRHSYVTYAWTPGPNAFVNCKAIENFSEIGPHQRLATAILYDCLTVENNKNSGGLGVIYIGPESSDGHGWRGVNVVSWNCCVPSSLRFYSYPAYGIWNWAVGCVGQKRVREDYGPFDGTWYPEVPFGGQATQHVSLNAVPSEAAAKPWWPQICDSSYPQPHSLYECQLYDRLCIKNLYFDK